MSSGNPPVSVEPKLPQKLPQSCEPPSQGPPRRAMVEAMRQFTAQDGGSMWGTALKRSPRVWVNCSSPWLPHHLCRETLAPSAMLSPFFLPTPHICGEVQACKHILATLKWWSSQDRPTMEDGKGWAHNWVRAQVERRKHNTE
jgi:hypothetical protein